MSENIKDNVLRFFAAANGYRGFRSYFDELFESGNFNRIYVLKGGPGTGKSSFMKAISEHFTKKCTYVEEIYCSSDPNSLDGVIVASKAGRIALLDGTSPHERDAVIPGAIDELINLGNGWDERFLIGRREEIVSLSGEKSKSYKSAYRYLKIAGVADEFVKEIHLAVFDKFKAKNEAEELLQDIPASDKGKVSTRLISSFGRYGEYRLDTLDKASSRKIFIGGNDISAMLFLNLCIDLLKEKGQKIIRLPYALDDSMTDGIFLPEHSLAILRGGDGDVNADKFIIISKSDSERIRKAEELKHEALDEAKRWFAIASNLHFRLEEIYGEAMNFDKNNQTLIKKISEIENILEIV